MINRQDFINSIIQDIDMVRGDTLAFNFQLQGLGGEMPDAITFSCAEHYNETPLFNADLEEENGIELEEYDAAKDIATYVVRIDPAKTVSLELGRYYYDLEMTIGDDVITLMRGRLTLVYEVLKGV